MKSYVKKMSIKDVGHSDTAQTTKWNVICLTKQFMGKKSWSQNRIVLQTTEHVMVILLIIVLIFLGA